MNVLAVRNFSLLPFAAYYILIIASGILIAVVQSKWPRKLLRKNISTGKISSDRTLLDWLINKVFHA